MEIISTTGLITINATFFVQLASFLILMWVINRIMFQPLLGIMEQRSFHMSQIKKQIKESEGKLEAFNANLQKEKHRVREAALTVNSEIESKAEVEANAIFAAAQKEIGQFREKNEREVAHQIQEAKKYFEQETQKLSTIMIERLLERRISQ
jgi:F-type H+-transporting ATPase subunit b